MGLIVGRAAELTSLRAAVSQGAAGRTRVVLIEGEAGIGKTTLLDAVADLARGEGIRVARGAGLELEADRPFGPLITTLDLDSKSRDPGRRAIAKLVSGVALSADGLAGSIPEHRYRAVDAICALIDHECAAGPLAVLVDDLHWADESTLLTLRRLARSPGIPLLLVATARPTAEESPAGQAIETLATAGAVRVRLRPLGKPQVRALVADLVGGPPGPRLLSLADGAGGNPLFLAELVAVLREDGSLRAGELGVEVADGAGTTDLARRLRARAARLGSEAAALVRVGAVLGTAFTLEEAARTGGWSAGDLLQPLDELLRAGFLVDTNGVLMFRHDLLRLAIEDELPPTARRALHAAAGRALVDTGASSARIARHLALGAEHGDTVAVAWLHRAAREAAPRAPATALTLLDTALALVAHDDPGRVELLADRVEALGWSGRNAEAEALARELIGQLEDRDTRLALRRQLGLALFIGNRPADAVEQLRISAEEVGDDPAARALALAEGALGCIASGQLDVARSFVDEAVGLAREHGAALALAVALSVESRLLAFGGHAREALAAAEEAHALAAGDDEIVRRQPGFFVVMCLLDLGLYDEVDALLREERRLAEERGVVWALPLHHAAAADRHLMLGELADAVTEATTGLTVAEDSGAMLPAVWLHAVMATVALHRGDVRAAEVHIGLGDQAMATTTPLLGADQHALAQARLMEARRDLAQAAALLRGAWDLFDAIGVLAAQRNIGFDALRLAHHSGDSDGVAHIAAGLVRVARLGSVPTDDVTAAFATALCGGDVDGMLAAADSTTWCKPLRRARMREMAAQALWQAGRPEEAALVLNAARRSYVAAGADGDVRRTADLFAALGLKRPPAERPVTGWDALTPSERRVADLVGTGGINATIAELLGVSRRTVETHLRHIYTKLGIAWRVELALTASRRADREPFGANPSN